MEEEHSKTQKNQKLKKYTFVNHVTLKVTIKMTTDDICQP